MSQAMKNSFTLLPGLPQIGVRGARYKLLWGQTSMLHRGFREQQYRGAGVNTEFQVNTAGGVVSS